MDEEENKKVEQSMGQKASGTVKKTKQTTSILKTFRKLLAVPILGKIILVLIFFLVIAFVIGGTVNFFFNMPNAVRDKLSEILSFDWAWPNYYDPAANISQKTLIAAATDLMIKGYDLEDYGFINSETYVNNVANNEAGADEITYNGETREIQSIRSKVLNAYIATDNATYVTANTSTNVTNTIKYSKELVMQIITDGNPDAKVDEEKLKPLFEYLETRFQMVMATSNKRFDRELFISTLAQAIREYKGGILGTGIGAGKNANLIPEITEDVIRERMGTDEDIELNFASGLIAFEGFLPPGVNIAIDRYNKQMIVAVRGKEPVKNKLAAYTKAVLEHEVDLEAEGETVISYINDEKDLQKWLEGLDDNYDQHIYYYNLDGWVTKYSRPYEFSLALHLSTMAPEFAYNIATSPETNAKVVMGMKETSVQVELVLDDEYVFPEGKTSAVNIGGSKVTGGANGNVDASGNGQEASKHNDILRGSDILALDQAYADIAAKYKELEESAKVLAEKKAGQVVERIAQQEADKAASSAASSAAAAAEEWENPDEIYARVYEQVYNQVYSKVDGDTGFKDWCQERLENAIFLQIILSGMNMNNDVEISNGTLKDSATGEVLLDKPDNAGGMKKEQYQQWLNQILEHYGNAYINQIDFLSEEAEGQEYWYDSPYSGSSDYELKIDDEWIFNTGAYDGSRIQKEIFDILLNEPDENVKAILDRLAQDHEYLLLNKTSLKYTKEDLQDIIKIFADIEKLYSLCTSINALKPQLEFTTYVPYIKRVINHWFRNLVFIREPSEELAAFNAYIDDVTRINYQYYKRYMRWSLDPLIVLFADYRDGNPDEFESGTGYKYNLVEQRANAIEQIDNPRVIDNSAYIRSLINDEYYTIYDGNEETSKQAGTAPKQKINVTKSSISSYATLETLPNETSEILVRNLKELFKDTTLSPDTQDMEEYAEVSTQKPLSNIFPDYKPYVPWPNIFEILETDHSKIMYKARNKDGVQMHHFLVAPTNGVITRILDNSFEFTYRNVEGTLNKLMVEIEDCEFDMTALVKDGDVVPHGADLIRIDVPKTQDYYVITISMMLTDNNGEVLDLADYMDVPQRELTAEEIITMHNYIMNEGAGQGEDGHAALASCIFNRIINPRGGFYEAVDIFSCIEITMKPTDGKDGSWVEKDLRTKLWGTERYEKLDEPSFGGADKVTRQILIGIARAWRGYDPTKPTVPMGADSYANKYKEKYKYENKKYVCFISSHAYYAIEEDYGDETNMAWNGEERIERYDEEAWQRRYLIYLCTTIENSYYFENSEVLEKIIAWVQMANEETARREQEKQNSIANNL